MTASHRNRWGRFGIHLLGLFLFLAIFTALPVFGQLPTATILGTVKDSSGAVIPEAKVTARNVDTGISRTANTENDGSYRFSALPVGNYAVDVEHAGFSRESRTGLTLTVGQEAVVNVTLNVGTTAQTVTITGEAPQVDTTSSALGGVVNEQKLQDLPLNGRNYLDLASLQPGVSSVGATEGQVRGLGGDIFVFNGATMRSNNYMLDGAILQNAYGMNSQSVAKTSLGVDGIKEFKVITDLFSAEYGLTMGGQITLVSKGGTNQFHGDAFEFLRNSALDSKNFFDSGPIPEYQRNQFGAAFGGPIKKDKTFFWAVYEGLRENTGLTELDPVPDPGCHGPAGAAIWNGVGAQPAGSIGPCSQLGPDPNNLGKTQSETVAISPIVAPLLAVLPSPNLPGGEFTFPAAQRTGVNYGQMRVDQNFSAADSFFARYTAEDANSNEPVNFPTVHDTLTSLSQFITLSETHIFSSSVINTFRTSYSRTGFVTTSIANLTSPSFVLGQPTGTFTPGSGLQGYGPEPIHGSIRQNVITGSDDVFWNKGRHALKFGTLVNLYGQAIDQGFFAYGTLGFNTFTQFLEALVHSANFTPAAANENRYYRYGTFGFYAQDDVRVNSRFTLNLGLRYEFNTTPRELHHKEYAFHDFATETATVPGSIVDNPSRKSFSPRFGFAWDVFGNGKTAVRGGAGIFYDIANIGSAMQQDASGTPPLSWQEGIFAPGGTPLILPLDLNPAAAVPCPPCQGVTLSTTTYFIQQPANYQWSLTVERQLPADLALGISYVGSRGVHLWSDPEGNQALPTSFVNGQPFWDPYTAAYGATSVGGVITPGSGQPDRINPFFSDDSLFTTRGDSWYNALEVSVTKRVTHGLTFQSSYTYSKLLDTPTGQTANQDLQTLNSSDPFNPFVDKGPSELDVTHQEKFNALYHFPILKSAGLVSKLLNGWWTGGIFTVQSGFAFSPVVGGNPSNDLNNQSERPDVVTAANVAAVRAGTYSRNGVLAGANPNAVPYDPNTVITGNLTPVFNNATNSFTSYGWFNPNMFIPGPPGFLGNASRGMLRGPGLTNLDFSLVKDTKLPFLGESGNLEFRAEFFNVLNRPNFNFNAQGGLDNGTYASEPTFIGPASMGLTRVSQASQSFDPTAGLINHALTPRQIQFGLRVEF